MPIAFTKRSCASSTVSSPSSPAACSARDRVEREVGRDGGGAVADQEREVHDLARLARLDDQAAPRARALAHEMAVHGGGGEQERDRAARRRRRRGRRARGSCAASATSREACLQRSSSARSSPAAPSLESNRRSSVPTRKRSRWQRAQLLEVARQQDGLGHRDPPGVLGRLVEEVPLRADGRAEAHHEGLALRVDRAGW